MPKVKVPRKSTLIDMTAMTDVAFLLLTFFMLTTQFKSDDSVVVALPSSISDIKLPDTDIMNITVTKDGRVFFGIDNKNFSRERLLDKISAKYNIQFTPQEQKAFYLTSSFGIPINALKGWLGLEEVERKSFKQPGIPIDSTNNELGVWIMQARLSNPGLRIAINGDGNVAYPVIKKVMATLQDKNVNKFNLITNLEANPNTKYKKPEEKK
ncbi:MAG TPA: biopolymer transporter ExbD [Ignavibacteriales bacterium]|nr:biopolymer transporter ExbD [Ignavibacteriales bacterium]